MLILLNGPPRSGKDTAAKFILLALRGSVRHYKMSIPLKGGVQKIFNMTPEDVIFANENPDEPMDILFSMSYRQAQIDLFLGLSSDYGLLILPRLAIRYLQRYQTMRHCVISDCGMTDEARAMISHYGEQVGVIKLHRKGCSFENDIREYVDVDCKKQEIIHNDYDMELYEAQVKKVLKKWGLIDDPI